MGILIRQGLLGGKILKHRLALAIVSRQVHQAEASYAYQFSVAISFLHEVEQQLVLFEHKWKTFISVFTLASY